MYKILNILILCIISIHKLSAQIFPQEGSRLCWRIVGFSFPAKTGTNRYTIEIAKGTYNTDSSFEKNIITSVYGKKNKIIAEVPSFGSEYTWRTVSVANNSIKTKSTLLHFSVKIIPDVDTAVTRLRIIKSAEKYKDHYVFIDGARALYNMKGAPVWFLPNADQKVYQDVYPRDIRITPQATITFIAGYNLYEITYTGNTIWYCLIDSNITRFHHEFTRLKNGHYMGIVIEKNIPGPLPVPDKNNDDIMADIYDSAGYHKSRVYNNIVEFDENKRLVWQWNGLEYKNNSDLRLRKTVDFPNMDKNHYNNRFLNNDLHENAFFFDEKNKTIYLSLRNISRIIKIKYPEGNILNTYGTIYKPGITEMGTNLFCFQHCCRLSQKGYLYLYDNNTCAASHLPKIVMMQESEPGKNDLKKIWEYECTVEGMDSLAIKNLLFYVGGNVLELPDQSMFVCMGAPYPKTFIVSLDKKILWSAISEKYDPEKKKWEAFNNFSYRASIISRKELEQLIWNSEK